MINPDRGILTLSPGDFAIIEMQFRVGDGEHITHDHAAIASCQALCLPCLAPWDGQDAELLDHELGAHFLSPFRSPVGLRAKFDHTTVDDWYADLLAHGEFAFLDSHHGPERSDAWRKKQMLMFEHGQKMLKDVEAIDPRQLEQDLRRYERAGLGSPMRIVEALRNMRMDP